MSQKRISTFFLPNPKIVKSSPQPNTEDQDQAPDKVATGTTAAIPASSQDASTDLSVPVVYGFTQNGMLCVASCMPYCKRVDLSRSIMMMMMMMMIIIII